MDRARLNGLLQWAVAFDTETHPIQTGLAAPPLVCGSVAWRDASGQTQTRLLDKEQTLLEIVRLLEDDRVTIVGAHVAYDLLVCAVEWARRGRDIFPLIYRALERGRIYDILIGEALGAIADGYLGKDPRTGKGLRDPITNEPNDRYNLAIVTDLRFGRKDAKANDEWRLKYHLLDGVPIALWPPAARDYPQDDVRNTLEDCLAQVGLIPSLCRHRWRESFNGSSVCANCSAVEGDEGVGPACWASRPCRNLHQMADQAGTAWALYLGAAWGFDVDQDSVTKEIDRVTEIRKAAAPRLIQLGFLRWKKEKGELKLGENRGAIARAVAEAYGARLPCQVCKGVGRVPKDKVPKRVAYDPQKHGRGCLTCGSSGYDLSTVPDLRMTDPSEKFPEGQIQANADVLNESGDERLRALADYKEDAKVVTSYGPYLREARRLDSLGRYYSVPLTLWPNVLLETDRTSYGGVIQLFPRDGALRACVRARRGFVLCSCDYNQGEVVTHAQSCLWIVGESRQADILLAGKEPHSMFGAAVLRVDYDEFFKNKKKNKTYANARQAAKPWIFGKPGGMGAVKLVQNQRAQGPDTPCPNGPVEVEDGKNPDGTPHMVRGYRGLRFCVLMAGAHACGVCPDGSPNMATRWGKGDYERDIAPTCRACLECAEKLQSDYFEQFPEARKYFRFTSDVVEHGQPLTDEQCDDHGLPHGSQLDPGEMCQHVSNIIRGGVTFCDCSNGYFQSLLAVAAKRALRRAQRECCDSSYVVPSDACPGGKVSKYAGKRSPLLGSRCIVLQHDEIIAELIESLAHEAAERLSEIMVRALQECCEDMAPVIKAPPALMPRWYKSAEPLYHYGRLVPWTPEHDEKTCPDCLAGNKAT